MKTVEFKTIDGKLHYRCLLVYTDSDTMVDSDGDDFSCNSRLVSNGYSEWELVE